MLKVSSGIPYILVIPRAWFLRNCISGVMVGVSSHLGELVVKKEGHVRVDMCTGAFNNLVLMLFVPLVNLLKFFFFQKLCFIVVSMCSSYDEKEIKACGFCTVLLPIF